MIEEVLTEEINKLRAKNIELENWNEELQKGSPNEGYQQRTSINTAKLEAEKEIVEEALKIAKKTIKQLEDQITTLSAENLVLAGKDTVGKESMRYSSAVYRVANSTSDAKTDNFLTEVKSRLGTEANLPPLPRSANRVHICFPSANEDLYSCD